MWPTHWPARCRKGAFAVDENTRKVVERWLMKARNDLRTAESVLRVSPPIADTACFHAQQCVEKMLKAVLTAKGRHVERTHSLPRLLELASYEDAELNSLRATSVELTDYALTGRYPDDWRDISIAEAKAAVHRASQAMELLMGKISALSGSALGGKTWMAQ